MCFSMLLRSVCTVGLMSGLFRSHSWGGTSSFLCGRRQRRDTDGKSIVMDQSRAGAQGCWCGGVGQHWFLFSSYPFLHPHFSLFILNSLLLPPPPLSSRIWYLVSWSQKGSRWKVKTPHHQHQSRKTVLPSLVHPQIWVQFKYYIKN